MSNLLPLTIAGLVTGCIYAITASGLVVTYTTTGIFNFAHGAIGMVAAFAYWEFSVNLHWPVLWALAFVLLVLAPLFGALIERFLMRPIRGRGLDITLTVTLGLLLFLIGLATILWNPQTARTVPQFFSTTSVKLGGIVVSGQQIVVIGVVIAVAITLRVFLYRTRAGITLRGVVDDPQLTALAGAAPLRYGQLGWAIGSVLAALAGILLSSLVTLNITTLTLLVINGYAAAMVGRLKNLPLTFVGGIALGLVQNYLVGYLPATSVINDVQPIVPMIFLFVALLCFPERRLAARTSLTVTPRVATLREAVIASGAFLVIAWIVSDFISGANLSTASHGVAVGLIMLSVVLLTGYGGQVSLCQMTFAGLGAVAMGKIAGGHSWLGVLAAIGLSAAVGAVVAVPTLRLRGLYLALATLAFADAMDNAFFQNLSVFGASGSLSIGRLGLPGISLTSDRAFFIFICVIFCLVAIGLLALRRSPFGRRLIALSNSPSASVTLGMNPVTTKLILFSVAAGLAGFGGALYGSQQGLVGPNDFQLLLSLTILLLAVVWGVRSTAGMLLAGVTYAIFPVIQSHVPALQDIEYLGTGLAAIGIGLNPNGAFGGDTPAQRWRDRRTARTQQALLAETDRQSVAPNEQEYVHAAH